MSFKPYSLTINNHRYVLSEERPFAHPGVLYAKGHGLMKCGDQIPGVSIDSPKDEVRVALRKLVEASIERRKATSLWVQENIERFLPSKV